MSTETQAPDPAPRPFTAVKAFADSVLAMLDERIKAVDQAAHPFNDYFGDKPETIVAGKAQAGELREVRTQVRILADRALVELMKFKPAIPAPEGAQAAALQELFEPWWEKSGQFCRAGGGGYEKTFAFYAWEAAIRAAMATPQAPAWQPIETLPDDTLAILYGAKRSEMVIGMRHSRDGWVIDTPSVWASMYPPKLWMPLPAAPQTKEPTNDR